VAKTARGDRQKTKRLLPGKLFWLAIAATSCIVFALLHFIFGSISADALTATTGVGKTVDVTTSIVDSIPMNFDVPTSFQAKTIKDAPVPAGEKVIALTFDDGPWPEYPRNSQTREDQGDFLHDRSAAEILA
jgi:peptidoglycan-N-acetylglucosamine deacetylase